MITSRPVPSPLAPVFAVSPGAYGQCEFEITAVIQTSPCPVTDGTLELKKRLEAVESQ